MKKLIFLSLALVLLLAAYLFGTVNARKVVSLPAAGWAAESDAAQAWREFGASMEAAAARIYAADIEHAERLEGLHYLAQLASVSLEMKLTKGSEQEPRFTDWMGDYRKFLGDSPDAVYHTAQLSPEFRYQVSGNRGDAEYLGFILYGRQLNGWNRATANLSGKDLKFDKAGNFTILLSKTIPKDAAANWLQLEDDTHMIMVRQYYHGRDGKTTANLDIQNLNVPEYLPPGGVDLAAGLNAATTFFNDTVDGAFALTAMLASEPNSFDPPSSYNADFGGIFYPTTDNEYYGGWIYLEDDEALIIEGAVPDAPYWAVSLQNRWMQSLDYEHYQVALNGQQIKTDNGRYRVVVSHQRPPSGNWLDTAGKREGLLSIRYQLSKNSEKPSLRLVRFNDL